LTAYSPATGTAALPVLGFLSQGPASIIASALVVDASDVHTTGGAAGFVDAMGYMGGAISTGLSGHLMDVWGETVGVRNAWRRVWWVWAAGVFAAAFMLLGVWRLKPRDHSA